MQPGFSSLTHCCCNIAPNWPKTCRDRQVCQTLGSAPTSVVTPTAAAVYATTSDYKLVKWRVKCLEHSVTRQFAFAIWSTCSLTLAVNCSLTYLRSPPGFGALSLPRSEPVSFFWLRRFAAWNSVCLCIASAFTRAACSADRVTSRLCRLHFRRVSTHCRGFGWC